jgi:molecular chaperone GrpE
VIPRQGDPREPRPAGPDATQGSPAGPGRAAEEPAVDGEAVPSPDDDRNLTPSEEGEGPTDSQKVERDLKELLEDAEQKKDEYLELAKRTQADFENYRRRMAAEAQSSAVRAKVELAGQLIGVLDNLERALEAAGIEPGAEKAPAEPLAEGFFLTYRELRAALERAGIESIHPTGERFDPNLHEALQKVPADGAEAGTVVEVMQTGYRLGDHLIRPARVVVSE